MLHNLEFASEALSDPHNFLIVDQIKRIIPCKKGHSKSFIL